MKGYKNVKLSTSDLELIIELLTEELRRLIQLLKLVPLDSDMDAIEVEANNLNYLIKYLERLKKEPVGDSPDDKDKAIRAAWQLGVEDTFKRLLGTT